RGRPEPRRPDVRPSAAGSRTRRAETFLDPPLRRLPARRRNGRRGSPSRGEEVMSSATSTTEPKTPPTNRAGMTVKEYGGLKSTLCVGCGHDVITRQITRALYELSFPPYKVAKMSGIGCSSKTTAYFADRGHGFNAVHGRMPAVATGAMMVNPSLVAVGVSGDGDTASIGAGQFVHLLRRNVPMVYIVENNGVYGLTKGQFSATADPGSRLKTGVVNDLPAIDLCAIAIEL